MAERIPQFENLTVAGASICLVARSPFHAGYDVLAIQRDNDPAIPYPNQWEFPGGTLDPGETAAGCALRELQEEVGLEIPEEWIDWEAFYPRARRDESGELIYTAFYGTEVDRFKLPEPVKGDEGQDCRWMPAATFTGHQPIPGSIKRVKAILDHRERYEDFIARETLSTPLAIGRKALQSVGIRSYGALRAS